MSRLIWREPAEGDYPEHPLVTQACEGVGAVISYDDDGSVLLQWSVRLTTQEGGVPVLNQTAEMLVAHIGEHIRDCMRTRADAVGPS